jgi:hypothetical protein
VAVRPCLVSESSRQKRDETRKNEKAQDIERTTEGITKEGDTWRGIQSVYREEKVMFALVSLYTQTVTSHVSP